MMAETQQALLIEMRAGMQAIFETVRSSSVDVGANSQANRQRIQYKKRRHNISSESAESRRSIPEKESVNENVNNNLNAHNNNPVRSAIGPLPAFNNQTNQRPILGSAAADHRSSSQRLLPEPQYRAGTYRTEMNIEKWGISYQGHRDSMTIEDFVFRVEYLKEQYGCSWAEIIRDFHRLLSGEAREWYWLYIRTNRNLDWTSLQFTLQRQFGSQLTDFDLMREITERKQKPGETIDDFFHAVGILRSRLRNPIPEYEMVRLVKGNLRESLAKLVYPIAVYSIEQLRMECKEVERCFPRRDRVPQGGFVLRSYQVNEIIDTSPEEQESPGDEGQVSVEELRYQRVTKHPSSRDQESRKNLVCWNCGVEGHAFTDCMSLQRRIFYFKCGKADVITPKCPICNLSGNAKRNAMLAGVSRSTQFPLE
ncbi:uncharacterized protein [Eurosta solidaginis]|uniref:uncharacterized protein isoform X1 n=1 Tax=Eurosta solidaginis TaxID=178769 RepID=UPI003530C41E